MKSNKKIIFTNIKNWAELKPSLDDLEKWRRIKISPEELKKWVFLKPAGNIRATIENFKKGVRSKKFMCLSSKYENVYVNGRRGE
jgi:hypothetical protein